MGVITFKLYSFLTILLAGGAIINSATIHEQFYPTIIYLTNQKSNKLIMLNFFFMIGLAFLSKIISIFFGESILDNLKRKIFDVIFIILVYKEDLVDQSFYVWMTVLAFIWVIHQITIKRSEYLLAESVTEPNLHIKLSFMYVLLICLDSVVLRYLMKLQQTINTEQTGYFFLFFLEYMLISLNIVYPAIKYFTNAFEMFTYSHFQQKNNILMVIEFIVTISKLTVQLYLRFKFMFLTPFFVDFIENVVQLYQTIVKFFSSVKLLRLLNKLPNVEEEDLVDVDNTCLICLSEIKEGKKIGCGHIFHKNCLKELIQGKSNQLCPKCRNPIQIEKAIQDHQNNLIKKKIKLDLQNLVPTTATTTTTNPSINQEQPNLSKENKTQSQDVVNGNSIGTNKSDNPIKQFSFFAQNNGIDPANKVQIFSIEDIIDNIGKLLNDKKNEPQIISKVKYLIKDIIFFETAIKTEEQMKFNVDLENILNFKHLLTNSNTSLKKCGAISYGLPKIANYNRSLADECLRKKIELMNTLLINCQRDLLLQTMFFSATNHILIQDKTIQTQLPNQQNNASEEHKQQAEEEEIEEQKNVTEKSNSFKYFEGQKYNNINPQPINNSNKQRGQIDPQQEEKERRMAWVERLQSQISQSNEQQQQQQDVSQSSNITPNDNNTKN